MTQIHLSPMESIPSSPNVENRITFESVRQWKFEQVSYWLQENNFKEYQKLFADNDINGDVLLELDHEILKELKIKSIGDRIRILLAVKSLLKSCMGNNNYTPLYTPTYTPTKFSYKEITGTPETDKFPPPLIRSDSLPKTSRVSSASNQKSPIVMSLESVKQRCIKVIGEDGHSSRTIPINNVNDAKSILAKVLQKFNIKDDVERYSLFTTLSDSGSARCLTDEEVEIICKSVDRPERERLFLRKKHLPMNHETFKKQMRDKKLANFFGEKPPSTPQGPQVGISQKKLRNFFGQRPPSELISLNLTEYFPGHNSEELERSRSSMRRASRVSMASKSSYRPKSRRISRIFDDSSRTSSILPLGTENIENDIISEISEEELEEFEDFDSFEEDEDDELTILKEAFTRTVFKWIKGALIGMGSFGSVYLGLNSITGELMAIKQVELPTGQSAHEERKKSMLDALQREISLLQELHHENIVQYLGSQHDEKTLNIFLEYVPGGSVATMLNNYGPLEETLVRSFNRQILQGLNYLHEKDIIHRDIKGANILVDNKGGIKISDFGISKKVEDQIMAAASVGRPSLQGSVFWMAPEVVRQTSYTSKADIWSLGCLIVEMITGTHPYPQFTQMQVIFKIGVESISPEIPEGISNEAKEFLKKTFESNHDDRPTAKVLLTHPFSASTSRQSPT